MIRFTVWKSGGQYRGFESSGHAGYADEGSDIVCAAVTALAFNTVNSIEQFTEDAFEGEAAEDGGRLRVWFPVSPGERASLLMDSLILGIQGIEAEYGTEYVRLIFEEV